MTPQSGCGKVALYADGLEWGVVDRCTRWPPCCPRAQSWIGDYGSTGHHARRLGRMALTADNPWDLVVSGP